VSRFIAILVCLSMKGGTHKRWKVGPFRFAVVVFSQNVYYIPPTGWDKGDRDEDDDDDDQRMFARGKLFDRTRNLKDWMRRKGLIPRVRGMRKSVPSKTSTENSSAGTSSPTLEPWSTLNGKTKLYLFVFS